MFLEAVAFIMRKKREAFREALGEALGEVPALLSNNTIVQKKKKSFSLFNLIQLNELSIE
jgi:hypothetical protein